MNQKPDLVWSRPTVLTVDDEADIREIVADELQEEGFNVVHAANGEEALAIVKESPPEVIVVDLLMPKMTGLQFLNRLKATNPVPYTAIVVSGLLEPWIVEACFNAGATTVIDKPFHLLDLRMAVRKTAGLER